jgi:hypothetical protein
MSDSNTEAGQLDHGLPWKSAPFEPVDIARDTRDRSDGLKLLDDRSLADVTSVEYMIDAPKTSYNRRIEQAMGIGNDADTDRA